jgi:hypothetical protein
VVVMFASLIIAVLIFLVDSAFENIMRMVYKILF